MQLTSPQDPEQLTSNDYGVLIVLTITSGISMLSSVLICYFYLIYQRLQQQFGPKLIFLLAFVDILSWANNFSSSVYSLSTGKNFYIFSKEKENWCIFIGLSFSIFTVYNFFLALIITIALYWDYCTNITYSLLKKRVFLLCIGFFVLSVFLSFIPLLTPYKYRAVHADHYIKCWLGNTNLIILLFYIPLWFSYIGIAVLVYKIYKNDQKRYSREVQMPRKYIWFPIIFVVCWTVPSIRRVLNDIQYQILGNKYDFNWYWLEIAMYLTYPMQGVVNAIVFGLINEFIKEKIIKILRCKCCEKDEEKLKDTEIVEAEEVQENEQNIQFLLEN